MYAGLQMNVDLPEGKTLYTATDHREPSPTDTAKSIVLASDTFMAHFPDSD